MDIANYGIVSPGMKIGGSVSLEHPLIVRKGGVLGADTISLSDVTVEEGGLLEGNVVIRGVLTVMKGAKADCAQIMAGKVVFEQGATVLVDKLFTGPGGFINNGANFGNKGGTDSSPNVLKLIEAALASHKASGTEAEVAPAQTAAPAEITAIAANGAEIPDPAEATTEV